MLPVNQFVTMFPNIGLIIRSCYFILLSFMAITQIILVEQY